MNYITFRKTNYLIDAISNNEPVQAKYIAIGIGSGVNEYSTRLTQEVYRTVLQSKGKKLIDGQLYQHITAFIPPSITNYRLTEIGILDQNENLIYFAIIDPPYLLTNESPRLVHIMIVYDSDAALVQFDSGLTNLVEHNMDPDAHPDIRAQLANIESRLVPDDYYADVFALMTRTPVSDALTVIEYESDSVISNNPAQYRIKRIRQTISPFNMVNIDRQYDLNKSTQYPIRETVHAKYFVLERRVEQFDSQGKPIYIVQHVRNRTLNTLNSEMKKLLQILQTPVCNFGITISYDDQTDLPILFTFAGDIDGRLSISYDSQNRPIRLDLSLFNNSIQTDATYQYLDNQEPINVRFSGFTELLGLVKTNGTITFGTAYMVNYLIANYGIWSLMQDREWIYDATIEETDVIHRLIVNYYERGPHIYNYWVEDRATNLVLRGYALEQIMDFGVITATMRQYKLS